MSMINSAGAFGAHLFIICLQVSLYGPVVIGFLGLGWLIAVKRNNPIASSFRKLSLLSAGIGYPLLIFLMSILMMPGSKAECRFGWLDCFVEGKLALTPLIFWSCAAFYAAQFRGNGDPPEKWIVWGLFMGAFVSGVCFTWEWLRINFMDGFNWFLLVPLYVCIWYATVCIRLFRKVEFDASDGIKTFLLAAPFWLLSGAWSYQIYRSLPEERSGCFVVTAATQGHEAIVGPFTRIERRGETRVVNRQLLTFWEFEALWKMRFPFIHSGFRRIYNFVGPYVARNIRAKVVADGVYLLLKPCEVMAAIAVSLSESSARKPIQGQHDI